jgi:hypothetical protein
VTALHCLGRPWQALAEALSMEVQAVRAKPAAVDAAGNPPGAMDDSVTGSGKRAAAPAAATAEASAAAWSRAGAVGRTAGGPALEPAPCVILAPEACQLHRTAPEPLVRPNCCALPISTQGGTALREPRSNLPWKRQNVVPPACQ